jgi:hypothetical protein
VAARSETIRGRGIDLAGNKAAGHVPEYLRGGSRRRWSPAVILASLIGVFLVVFWQSVGSWNRVGQMLARRDVAAPSTTPQSSANPGNNGATGNAMLSNSQNAVPTRNGNASTRGATSNPHANSGDRLPNPTDNSDAIGAATTSSTDRNLPQSSNPNVVSNDANSTRPRGNDTGQTAGNDGGPGDNSSDRNSTPSPGNALATTAGNAAPSIAGNANPTGTGSNGISDALRAGQWMIVDRSESESIVFSVDTVGNNGTRIVRLNPGDSFEFGKRLIVPPFYRPQFSFGKGIKWTVAGPSNLTVVQRPTAEGVSRIAMNLGRAVLQGADGVSMVRVEGAGQQFDIRFDNANASCACELSYQHTPGSGPRDSDVVVPIWTWYGVTGEVQITGGSYSDGARTTGSSAVRLTTNQHLKWVKDRSTSTAAQPTELPAWVQMKDGRPIDHVAATDLYRYLSNANASDILVELYSLVRNRRAETAMLATRTLMLLGDYSTLFSLESSKEGLLNRANARSHWQGVLDGLWDAVGSDPQGMTWLMLAIEKNPPPRVDLLKMLVFGFSDNTLASGGDRKLVDALSSQLMDERVLAIYQLNAITGRDNGFSADRPSPESVQQWQKDLSSGRIRKQPQ